jgi:dienelactone hydrolase
MRRRSLLALLFALFLSSPLSAEDAAPLPGTQPLTMEGDIAAQLVEGVDKFLLRKIKESPAARAAAWKVDVSSKEAYLKSVEPNRARLAKMLGIKDARIPFDAPEIITTVKDNGPLATGPNYEVHVVRWPAFGDVSGEGLLLTPRGDFKPVADIIAIPDADQTPEQLVGLEKGLPLKQQFARMLAESGCRVLIPTLINRELKPRNARAVMTNREYAYRPAFSLGRHLIGYEIQKVLAGVDWFTKEAGDRERSIGVMGYGEGGLLAFYAAAVDTRIDAVCVNGYLGPREAMWKQPIDRNVFGLLTEFGDAEVCQLIRPRPLVAFNGVGPAVELPSSGGAPGILHSVGTIGFLKEFVRAGSIAGKSDVVPALINSESTTASSIVSEKSTSFFLNELCGQKLTFTESLPEAHRPLPASQIRQERQLKELDRHTQQLLTESPYVRAEFMKGLDTSSPEAYAKTVETYREKFKREVIGWFDDERLPFNPRTRKIFDKEKYVGYEVVLDVWPDVIAYGILLLPKDMKADEQRPVVVCQHGLEGRPQDIVQGDHPAYHDFAAKLAERGFITFSPQNLYIGKDKFRTLQRKANPLGKTLFSIIIPQHQQIVDWLKTQPNVDDKRIAFYGLSYGGKSAMRIPPLVPDYCLSICSADFNEWVWKNASTRSPYSYVWTNEYEIFEWDLGSTFNYAEMAALIAPRPFMVERGHADGVAPDETVGYEFAKVYNLYNARLKVGDRCEIEWFDGPHTINGKGTFKFLHKHLKWPEPKLQASDSE